MDRYEEESRKEVRRICRSFLELSIESYSSFNAMIEHVFRSGNEDAQAFARKPSEGLLQWLRGVTDFIRYVRKHIQDGRLNLVTYLREPVLAQTVADIHRKRCETKTELFTKIEDMLKGIFDLTPVAHHQAELVRATQSKPR